MYPLRDQLLLKLENKVTMQTVTSSEEYKAISESDRYDFAVIVTCMAPPLTQEILNDQVPKNQQLKFVQALSAGIDYFKECTAFKESDIPLLNVKGAFSEVLGEFIALGMLYHTKKLESFMQKKAEKKWEKETVDLVSDKTMLIVGYGDIGAACGKIAKFGFGTKVIGLKRRPEITSAEAKACADEVHGMD
jgi:phosphoglycerate dehydrogenase-like enzyme